MELLIASQKYQSENWHVGFKVRPNDTMLVPVAEVMDQKPMVDARVMARLFSAAPELLEALRECITDEPGAACYNTGKKTRRLNAINEIARQAIARATGE